MANCGINTRIHTWPGSKCTHLLPCISIGEVGGEGGKHSIMNTESSEVISL